MASVADILELPRNRAPQPRRAKYDPYRDKRQADRSRRDAELDDQPTEAGDDTDIFITLKSWFEDGRDKTQAWRDAAREADDLTAGWQWDEDDIAILQKEHRPVVTFNRIGRNIDLISGMEEQDRKVVAFQPREEGDVGKSDVLTGAAEYVIDQTDASDEKSDAFRDLTIRGLGWTQTTMNYLDYEAGMPDEMRVDGLEVVWDPYSVRRNLKDRRWNGRARTMPISEAKRLFPKTDAGLLHAAWARFDEEPIEAGDRNRRYESDSMSPPKERALERDRVTIIEMEWYEIEDAVLIEDLFTGERTTLPKKRAKALTDGFPGRYLGQPMPRKCYYRAFLGAEILAGPIKLEKVKSFTFEPMTGKRCRKQLWYGMVRMMADPQKWANKWLAQSMHIMNRGAKNGFWFETDSIVDPVKVERDITKPGVLAELKPGTLSNGSAPVPIGQADFPDELSNLFQFAMQSIQDCGGINNEQLGTTGENTADANRAALLEQGRRKAGITLMTHFFKSLRLHTVRQGRLLLRYIMAFMNDGRLIKISGERNQQYARLIIEDPESVEYDIDVGDAPDSPDQRERNWAVMAPLMPLMESLQPPPELWVKVLRYSPLPAALVDDIERTIKEAAEREQGQQQPPDPQLIKAQTEAQMTPAQIEKIMAEIEKLRAQTQEIMGRMQLDALEGIRETVAVDDAREKNKLTTHENA